MHCAETEGQTPHILVLYEVISQNGMANLRLGKVGLVNQQRCGWEGWAPGFYGTVHGAVLWEERIRCPPHKDLMPAGGDGCASPSD